MREPATSRTIWMGCALVSLPAIILIVLQAVMLLNASRMSDDLQKIRADVVAIANDDGFAETNRALAQLTEQSRVRERLLDRP